MNTDKQKNQTPSEGKPEYTPPSGSTTEMDVQTEFAGTARCSVVAEWAVLRKKEKPSAEIFHVAYILDSKNDKKRPVTFIFNGGPGAASAYLHLGAVGPKIVAFNQNGKTPAPPAELRNNVNTWLDFTDLVFVDPVGTGFSRIVENQNGEKTGDSGESKGKRENDEKEYFGLKRDLESLGEFMQRFLSKHHRWESPVFVAGESYGGFRAARLARLLQHGYGIGLNGVIVLSPALEFSVLDSSDYDVLPWMDVFPSMAAAAAFHGRSERFSPESAIEDVLSEAEKFATTELSLMLIDGESMSEQRRRRTIKRAANFLGIEPSFVERTAGRVRPGLFVRELLRESRTVCGLYDATITVVDPYPDRDTFEGPDPTLYGMERVFTAGINSLLRHTLELETERDYRLLSMEVNRSWKIDVERHALESQVGATDELRYGMSINPHMKVLICHGYYDLVTPYFTSKRLTRHMKLDENQRKNLELRNFPGGHMFYTWEKSRKELHSSVRKLVGEASGG